VPRQGRRNLHRVVKGYWQDEAIDRCKAEIESITNWREKEKKRMSNRDFPPTIGKIIQRATSKDFINRFIGYGLIPDPEFHGGGVHSCQPGCFLRMHRDFNHVVGLGWRVSNLLLYLNRTWKGGELLTGGDRIAPEANTMVILSPEDWHGHPEPCGEQRDSIALYYYTKEKPHWMTERLTTDYNYSG
jgi:hypothetical protein